MERFLGKQPAIVRQRGRAAPPRWVAVLALLSLTESTGCEKGNGRTPFEARVVGVSDGDTITVLYRRTQEGIRLNGIDCPEKAQPFGSRAKQLTSELAFGKTVTVRPVSRDQYRRTVADVILPDGRSLSHELVAAGLAWHYTRYSKDETLANLERKAREVRIGLWSEGRAIPPWEFRAARRGDGR